MKPDEIIDYLGKIGAKLHLKGHKLVCDAPKNVINFFLLETIKAKKYELIDLLNQKDTVTRKVEEPAFKLVDRQISHPLSYAQKRMMVLYSIENDEGVFNHSLAFEIKGKLSISKLNAAFQSVVEQFEMMRTRFIWIENEPLQFIDRDATLHIDQIDLRNDKTTDYDEMCLSILRNEHQRPFDLTQAPLLKVLLLRKADSIYILLILTNYLVADEQSLALIVNKVSDYYNGIDKCKKTAGKEKFQYVDFVSWEKAYLASHDSKEKLEFWVDRLTRWAKNQQRMSGVARRDLRTFKSAETEFFFPKETTKNILKSSRNLNSSLFILTYSIFSILLARLHGENRFFCVTPLINRSRIELENMVGYFANTIILKNELLDDQFFEDYITSVKKEVINAFSNGDIPFEHALDKARVDANLFNRFMFTFAEDYYDPPQFTDATTQQLGIDLEVIQTSISDLSITLRKINDQLQCCLLYPQDLFEINAIENIIKDFIKIAEKIIAAPQSTISDLKNICEVNKIDYENLPSSCLNHPFGYKRWPNQNVAFVAPRTPTEKALAEIWQNLLRIKSVGIYDNFFELGGQSLLAIKAIMHAGRLGISIKPRLIFLHPTISELATIVDKNASENSENSKKSSTGPVGSVPLTAAQIRFLEERNTCNPHRWNFSLLFQTQQVNPVSIETTLKRLVNHHDALRLRISKDNGEWKQQISENACEFRFESHNLSSMDTKQRRTRIATICEKMQGGINISYGPVISAAHFDCGHEEPDRLFFLMHHFIMDQASWLIFWDDFLLAYKQHLAGINVELPPKTNSYREWSIGIRELADSKEVHSVIPRWLELPWDELSRLPYDFPFTDDANTNESADDVEILISPEKSNLIFRPQGNRRPEEIILAVLAQTIGEWSGSSAVLIDSLNHGRDIVPDANLSRTVGFMLCYHPVLLQIVDGDDPEKNQQALIKQIRQLPPGYSFDLIRLFNKENDVKKRFSNLPRAEILFNFSGYQDEMTLEGYPDFSTCNDECGSEFDPLNCRYYPIAIHVAITKEGLSFRFAYSKNLHNRCTIEDLVDRVNKRLQAVANCRAFRNFVK